MIVCSVIHHLSASVGQLLSIIWMRKPLMLNGVIVLSGCVNRSVSFSFLAGTMMKMTVSRLLRKVAH